MCGSPHPKTGAGRLELAQIFREHGEAYRRAHRLCAQQRRVMQAIEDCRTAALGGHLEACDRCGAEIARYHSCRNRHCPKCQTLAKERWVEARCAELLPVPYFHLVFTLPHENNSLAQGNPKVIDGLLFQAASDTLQTFGRDRKWLGGEIGITMVLHTWGQNLSQHLLSRAQHRRKPLPALWPRTAAPDQSTPPSSSGYRPSVLAMGRLNRTGRSPVVMRYRMNRTGRSPAFMRYRMNRHASPLRRPRPTPPQAPSRPRLPLTRPRFRTILSDEPNSPIDMEKPSHDRRHEPTGTASRSRPAPYNPQGS
ncbi:MAG: IS91 family transposase [Gammaproteobacteria bacterium]